MQRVAVLGAALALACGAPDTDLEFGPLPGAAGDSASGGASSGGAGASGAAGSGGSAGQGLAGASASGGSANAPGSAGAGGGNCDLGCNSPPPPQCVGSATLRIFEPQGKCMGGSCVYPHSDSACSEGCAGGVCTGCTAEVMTVDAPGDVGTNPAIAAAADGTLYIAYRDSSKNDLKLARRSPGAAWHTEALDKKGGSEVSIQALGDAVSIYFKASAAKKLAVKPAGGAFSVTNNQGYYHPSVHVVHAGGAELFAVSSSSLRHSMVSPSWKVVSTKSVYSTGCSIKSGEIAAARDSQGGLHAVARCGYAKGPLYAYRPADGSWKSHKVETSGGDYVALAMDASDTVFLAYRRDSGDKLMLATRSGSSGWTSKFNLEKIDSGGKHVSLAVDGKGAVHALYVKYPGQLSHAVKTPAQLGWALQPELDLLEGGGEIATTTDSGGVVHVAYHNVQGKDLKYARVCP